MIEWQRWHLALSCMYTKVPSGCSCCESDRHKPPCSFDCPLTPSLVRSVNLPGTLVHWYTGTTFKNVRYRRYADESAGVTTTRLRMTEWTSGVDWIWYAQRPRGGARAPVYLRGKNRWLNSSRLSAIIRRCSTVSSLSPRASLSATLLRPGSLTEKFSPLRLYFKATFYRSIVISSSCFSGTKIA